MNHRKKTVHSISVVVDQVYEPTSLPKSGDNRLDLAQKLERRFARLNESENPLRRWSLEIASWVVSAMCMASIIGILVYLKDGPVSRWPIGLTFVTILAKIATATLIIPTSEAIGQLKWNWFQGPTSREMEDFEVFDRASRGGPLGSVMLLLRTKGRSLAAVGALLMILMLAMDTFFQQVTLLPEIWLLQGQAFLPVVTQLEHQAPRSWIYGVESPQTDPELETLLDEFFVGNGSHPKQAGAGFQAEIPVSCSTSNCTWSSHRTLGVCSACEDVSSLLRYGCISSTMDWVRNTSRSLTASTFPHGTMCGYFINATSESPLMMTGYTTGLNSTFPAQALVARGLPLVDPMSRETSFGGSLHFGHIRNPIGDFIITGVEDIDSVYSNSTPFAKECVLYWCVQELNSAYSGGAYEEELISSFFNSTPGPQPWVTTLIEAPIDGPLYDYYYTEDVVISVPSETNQWSYGLSNMTMLLTVAAFDNVLPFFSTMDNTSDIVSTRLRYYSAQNHEMRPDVNPWVPSNNITQHIERLAISMTNVMRSTSREQAIGGAYDAEVRVQVRWAWLTFPLIILVLSLLFLVLTIRRVSCEGGPATVWKNSSMPILIYSMPKDTQQSLAAGGVLDKSRARATRIRLADSTGWRVSGCSSEPVTPVAMGSPPPI